MKREVKEETFLDMEPYSLICVESNAPGWFRFTFTGECSGQQIKTSSMADEHSIEAKWFHVKDVLHSDKSGLSLRWLIYISFP